MKSVSQSKPNRRRYLNMSATSAAASAPYLLTAHAAPDDPIIIGLLAAGRVPVPTVVALER